MGNLLTSRRASAGFLRHVRVGVLICGCMGVGLSGCFLDRSAAQPRPCANDVECGTGAFCVGGACQAFSDGGGRDGGGRDAGPDAFVPPVDGGPDTGIDSGTDSGADAGTDAGVPTCPGELVPVGALGVGSVGEPVCTSTGVLARGGAVAGLGRQTTSPALVVDGRAVVSCVRADFSELTPVSSVVARVRAVEMSCGSVCGAGLCGQGHTALVFGAPDFASFRLLGSLSTDTAFSDYLVPASASLRTVLVCRESHSAYRDHVEVDFIGLCP